VEEGRVQLAADLETAGAVPGERLVSEFAPQVLEHLLIDYLPEATVAG
jgi:hypothetical protein